MIVVADRVTLRGIES